VCSVASIDGIAPIGNALDSVFGQIPTRKSTPPMHHLNPRCKANNARLATSLCLLVSAYPNIQESNQSLLLWCA